MVNLSFSPPFIYGTAWKQDKTSELVVDAVLAGFRAIDTANQKKHYREDFVGEALIKLRGQGFSRDSLFLQTKYTYVQGQDHRLPYDPTDPFSRQVQDSLNSSLKNLHTDYVDSFLLHGPSTHRGLTDTDWEVWGTMEQLCKAGKTRIIGLSNVNLPQLKSIVERASIKPSMVQNRCYADQGWDRLVREYCRENGIIYQGFSLLTANWDLLNNDRIVEMAARLGVGPQQILLRFASQVGMLPLTGTTNKQHMIEDLNMFAFELSPSELKAIDHIYGA